MKGLVVTSAPLCFGKGVYYTSYLGCGALARCALNQIRHTHSFASSLGGLSTGGCGAVSKVQEFPCDTKKVIVTKGTQEKARFLIVQWSSDLQNKVPIPINFLGRRLQRTGHRSHSSELLYLVADHMLITPYLTWLVDEIGKVKLGEARENGSGLQLFPLQQIAIVLAFSNSLPILCPEVLQESPHQMHYP